LRAADAGGELRVTRLERREATAQTVHLRLPRGSLGVELRTRVEPAEARRAEGGERKHDADGCGRKADAAGLVPGPVRPGGPLVVGVSSARLKSFAPRRSRRYRRGPECRSRSE